MTADQKSGNPEQEQIVKYIETEVGAHVRAAGFNPDTVRKLRQTVVIRAFGQIAVPGPLRSLISELSPDSLGVCGIELSHYPDLQDLNEAPRQASRDAVASLSSLREETGSIHPHPKNMPRSSASYDNGSKSQRMRNDLTMVTWLPAAPVPGNMRKIAAINQTLPWQEKILPNEVSMDRIFFDSNIYPMTCGVLGNGILISPLTGGIELEQSKRRIIPPETLGFAVLALVNFQPFSRYARKTIAVF